MSTFYVVFLSDRHPEIFAILNAFFQEQAPYCWISGENVIENPKPESLLNGFWPYSDTTWHFLDGASKNRVNSRFDFFTNHTPEHCVTYLKSIADNCSWAFLPWGREESMAMIAFVCKDVSFYRRVLSIANVDSESLKSGISAGDPLKNSAPLVISAYDSYEGFLESYRGILFNCHNTEKRISHIADQCNNLPYILTFQQAKPPSDNKNSLLGARKVKEFAKKDSSIPILIQLETQDLLKRYLKDWNTVMILSGGANLSQIEVIVSDKQFEMHTAFYYIPSIISCCEWLYLPENGYSSSEMAKTFVAKDGKLASSFLSVEPEISVF